VSDILTATRHAIVSAILAEPWEATHRYALADSYEEVGDAGNHTVEDLRMDSGMWLVRYRKPSYRLLWVARVLAHGSMPACFEVGVPAAQARTIHPAINVSRLPKSLVPECHTTKQIPLDGRPARKCAKGGRCQPFQRIASRHSGRKWCCPGAYVRIGAPRAHGIYLA